MQSRRAFALVLAVPMVLMGCEHAPWGNAMALGVSVFLFVGTLQLGRRGAEAPKGEAVGSTQSNG
ncbi:MAG: hypothetical protein JNK72_06170 [Myxococcales bacterium]|nr:hypothetical protein [Myxococcales bacterium]